MPTTSSTTVLLSITFLLNACSTEKPDTKAPSDKSHPPSTAKSKPNPPLNLKPIKNSRQIMHQKLAHAQVILHAMATEDFDAMKSSAKQIVKLTNMAQWLVINHPDYLRYSEGFKRAASALVADAKTADVDGATLHYFQMTMNCVDCHMAVRKLHLSP